MQFRIRVVTSMLVFCLDLTFRTTLTVESFVMPVRSNRIRNSFVATTSVGMTQKNIEIAEMKVSEIRAELKELNIDYSDCFDKESLIERLRDARDGKAKSTRKEKVENITKSYGHNSKENSSSEKDNDVWEEVRSMSVRALREELANRGIRWADLFEKNDLVQAVVEARRNAASFSATGLLLPGKVVDLSGENLQVEIESKTVSTPLLVDIYATWCGPCKLMAEQLKGAASDFSGRIRFAKMDSDKYAPVAAQFRVQGLPTLILFRDGVEIDRLEGALMKEQLVQWIESRL